MNPRAALACIGVVAAGILGSVAPARAGDLVFAQGYGTRAVEPCNRFADDSGSSGSSEPCPRFGGRVRVDLGAPTRAGSRYGAAPAAVRVDPGGDDRSGGPLAAPDGFGADPGITRNHLRIQGPSTTGP
jgi:hypothetical protein